MLRLVVGTMLLIVVGSLLLLQTSGCESLIWHYQLQGATEQTLNSLKLSYYVVDLDEFEGDPKKVSGTVLAYISVGETENYRDYWNSIPRDLLLYENPEWRGNYIVKFWDERWKVVVESLIHRAKERGFDGVYLDGVDVYKELNRESEMVLLVCQLAGLARLLDLKIFIQNGVELYPKVRWCIDGMGKEDTWFFDDKEIPLEDREHQLRVLRMVRSDGKPVLAIDYPKKMENVCKFYNLCSREGFYRTVSNRELDMNRPITCPSS